MENFWGIVKLLVPLALSAYLFYVSINNKKRLRKEAVELYGQVNSSVSYRRTNYRDFNRYESMNENNYRKYSLANQKYLESKKMNIRIVVAVIVFGFCFIKLLERISILVQ